MSDGAAPPEYLAFGDLGVDSVVLLEHLPLPGEKLWVEPVGEFPGGMIGNAAATAAALGVSAGVVSLLGDDDRGDLVMTDLRARGVDHRFVRRVPGATFWTLSLTTPQGERSLIQFPSPAFAADWEGFDHSSLRGVRWVHTAAEQGDPVGELFEEARRRGITTSLDVEHPFVLREDLTDLFGLSDVVFMNRAAAEVLGGPAAAARQAAKGGAGVALVTLGQDGALLAERNGRVVVIPPIPVETIDSNGAGDCFAAAFAVARIRGWEPRPAAEFANVVGAISTTALGGHGATLASEAISEAARTAGLDWSERLP